MNKRWEYNKSDDSWNLYFTQFYEEELILSFSKLDEDYFSIIFYKKPIRIYEEILESETVEDAKEECENIIENFIQDEISYYKDMLEKFREE